ncbi:hypothetical protein [Streptomyces sp. NPDC002580]|uniref:hypothetical protein n=1 Tax=Streptomyces sp. NPDC002580 TaxID=3364653 RepID=UPI0036A91AD2
MSPACLVLGALRLPKTGTRPDQAPLHRATRPPALPHPATRHQAPPDRAARHPAPSRQTPPHPVPQTAPPAAETRRLPHGADTDGLYHPALFMLAGAVLLLAVTLIDRSLHDLTPRKA